jgi:DNA primase
MAKTYIDVVKYMVNAKFDISGLVDKPDIIGAVFGQTEGLLGGGLDLRELQKNGKIGRIEIDVSTGEGKTFGKLFLPSSLGRVETCILAAAIESVDRVGPFETAFKVEKIEDTRNEKRRKIINRAKDLLKTLLTTEIPDSKEISEVVESDVKSSVVTTYGPDNLPAGPDIAGNQEVILVEGRADVVNLLKNDIDNCIAIGGAIGNIPKTIVDLSRSKETTLFVDGDRGGEMIIRGVLNVAEIDYIAKAPEGREVEELTRKDIIKSLRSRVPIEQAVSNSRSNGGGEQSMQQARRQEQFDSRQRFQQQRSRFGGPEQAPQAPQAPQASQQSSVSAPSSPAPSTPAPSSSYSSAPQARILSPTELSNRMLNRAPDSRDNRSQDAREYSRGELGIKDITQSSTRSASGGIETIPTIGRQQAAPQAAPQPAPQQTAPADPKFTASLDELHNTLRGRLYDNSGNITSEVPIRELIQAVQDTSNIGVIVFDGIITQRLVELASKQGVKSIYGVRSGQLSRHFDNMLLYTKEQGKL